MRRAGSAAIGGIILTAGVMGLILGAGAPTSAAEPLDLVRLRGVDPQIRTCVREIRHMPLRDAADKVGELFGIPLGLMPALITRENSTWNRTALSPKGARGLTQVMPATADFKRHPTHHAEWIEKHQDEYKADLAAMDRELQAPHNALCWGALILKELHDRVGDCVDDDCTWSIDGTAAALAGYNAGSGVTDYVTDILEHWKAAN